jgi:uncharacterized protein with ATP-grasp and redox domains
MRKEFLNKLQKIEVNMKVYLDCLPCMLRQVLEASRMSTENEKLQCSIIDEAIGVLNQYKSYSNSPEIGRDLHRIVKKQTGVLDPYSQIKQRDLQTALSLYPHIKQFTQNEQNRLFWALKAAAVGNVLDSAIHAGCDIEKSVESELKKPFAVCDIEYLESQLETAKSILIIGDNTGETVFDCLLLDQLSGYKLTYAVRSAPILNDATAEEAQASGIGRYARIISTGCDVPGVLLGECSQAFLDIFYGADIVITKGQGNYETLSDCDRDIYFLLKAKCPVLSVLLGVDLNDYVFKYNRCANTKEPNQKDS